MTILTIITNANDVIIYFENPLERGFEYIRLISCSLFNSWYNLKEKGEIGLVNEGITSTMKIPPGNYTLSSIGKKLQEIFAEDGIEVKFDDASSPIVIKNPLNKNVLFDRDLTYLLGLGSGNQRARLKNRLSLIVWSHLTIISSTAISWIKMKIYSMESHPRYLPVLTSLENHSKEWNIHQKTL